jgi:hypothetical protein
MVAYIRKAITAGIVTGIAFAIKDWDGGITSDEWIQIIGATLAAATATYAVPNAKDGTA